MFNDAALLYIPSPQVKDMKTTGFSRSSPDIVAAKPRECYSYGDSFPILLNGNNN